LNNSPTLISSSLFDALHHLRSKTSHCEIWVDALCINQSDMLERNHPSLIPTALNDILQREYFRWIWVVQENALAAKNTLQVGRETSPGAAPRSRLMRCIENSLKLLTGRTGMRWIIWTTKRGRDWQPRRREQFARRGPQVWLDPSAVGSRSTSVLLDVRSTCPR
ncbi:hypothetical protein BU23DRAFT_455614, partial [Bimuria novae-zelandiae CBS 107.79]